MEKIDYKGWPNCYRLSNDVIDLVITADVGPRIIRFGFVGEDNEFGEFKDMLGKAGGDEWRAYGGHRLWHAPEVKPRTYFSDNEPVKVKERAGGLRVVQPVETATGIQKEIDVQLAPDEARVKVTHRLRNRNVWAVELAPWALSVMAQGGRAIIPLPPRAPHGQDDNFVPSNVIALWPCTEMADPRWTWGSRYIMLRQDPKMAKAQKVGVAVPDGWAAYARKGHLFVKKFSHITEARYPDLGCSVETYTDADILEIEMLGPLTLLQPGAAVEHVEHWFLFRDVPVPASDADVERDVLSRVRAAKVQ
jgi:hypothetical protein